MTNEQCKLSELLPCPFCGSKPVMGYSKRDEAWEIYCDGEWCDARITGWTDGERESAIRAWNTRATVNDQMTAAEGFALVPIAPTDAMFDAGRNAVMARDCSSAKWSPRQHYKAAGISTDGIPDNLLDGYHSIIPKGQGAALVYAAMIAARPKYKEPRDE